MSDYNATYTEYVDFLERWIQSGCPSSGMIGSAKPTKANLIDAIGRVQKYRKNNSKNPPKVWIYDGTSTPTPSQSTDCYNSQRYLTDSNIKQDTNYFCACNVFQQIMYELYGIVIKESDIASAMGTTTNGTSHQQIINGGKAIAQKYGHSVSIEFKNYSDLTEKQLGELIADPNVGVFIHDLYKLTWGHYEYLIGLCISTGIYTVANSLSGGYIEKRSRAAMKSYISGISQPSVGIVRKIS